MSATHAQKSLDNFSKHEGWRLLENAQHQHNNRTARNEFLWRGYDNDIANQDAASK